MWSEAIGQESELRPAADARREPKGIQVHPDSALRQTLLALTDLTSDARDDWWIIGSAAVALHVPHLEDVADVDLVMSVRDAQTLLSAPQAQVLTGKPSALFRSAVFGVWRGAPLAVDVMADFSVRTADGWMDVRPKTRERFEIADRQVFAPSRAELRQILATFGRPKDLDRAALLLGDA